MLILPYQDYCWIRNNIYPCSVELFTIEESCFINRNFLGHFILVLLWYSPFLTTLQYLKSKSIKLTHLTLLSNNLSLEKGVALYLNIFFTKGCFVPSLVEIGPMVLGKMKMWRTDGRGKIDILRTESKWCIIKRLSSKEEFKTVIFYWYMSVYWIVF